MVETTATKSKTELSRARDRLSRYLALRDHSRYELKTKLSRAFPPEIVDAVLLEAEERRLLMPDDEVAERLVAQLQRKLKSRRYIEAQLKRRHLSWPQQVESDEVDRVRALVERRFGDLQELDREQRLKAYRYLKYRGFEDRWIRQVLNAKS